MRRIGSAQLASPRADSSELITARPVRCKRKLSEQFPRSPFVGTHSLQVELLTNCLCVARKDGCEPRHYTSGTRSERSIGHRSAVAAIELFSTEVDRHHDAEPHTRRLLHRGSTQAELPGDRASLLHKVDSGFVADIGSIKRFDNLVSNSFLLHQDPKGLVHSSEIVWETLL